jgi:hypothetical protein
MSRWRCWVMGLAPPEPPGGLMLKRGIAEKGRGAEGGVG